MNTKFLCVNARTNDLFLSSVMNEAHFSEIPNNRNNNALECAFIILDGFDDLPGSLNN